MKRKIISLLLCFVMALSLIPTVAFGVDEGPSDPLTTNGAYSDNGWSAGGTGTITTTDGLTLSKTATYLSENTYRIDLKVITKQTTTTVTTSSDAATVLVIDCSGSMAWCSNNHRHTDNCYSTEECTPESNPSHWVDALGRQWHAWDTSCRYDLNSGKYYKVSNTCGQTQHTHDNATGGKWCGGSGDPRIKSAKDAAMTFIDNYKDSSAERWVAVVSFANSEASSNWFNVSTSEGYTGAETFINNLDASGATNLDAGLSAASNLMSQNTVSAVVKDNKNVIALTDGAPTKSASHGNGQYGSSQINDQTKNTATTLKGNVNALYTICFGASGETCYQGGPTVDAFLKNSIASSGNAYTADTASDLDLAFGKITDTITSGLDGKGWTVTDPMADNITVTGTLPENFTLTDDTSKTYTWTLNNPTVEENGSEKVYIYATSYNVTIDPNGAGLNEKDFYPANKVTTLNYSDADGTSKTATFPVPGVKVKLPAPTTGSLIITKAFIGLPDGTTPDSVSFTVTGPNSYNQTVTLSANNQWTQTLSNLTPGSYTVSEDETSAQVNGYVLTADEAKAITVAGGQTASASFTNTYDALPTATDTITIPVEKVWSDGNANHANDSVTVKLLNGGKETDKTLTLNAQNSWKGSFTNVPADGSYTVFEVAVDGYTASYTQPVITGLSVSDWGTKVTPASNSSYDVTGNLIVANKGKNYYIWTLDPLTDTQKNDLMAAVNAADLQGLGKTLTARNTTFESGETASFNNGAVQIAGGKITFAAENVWSMFYCGTVTLSSVTDAKINNSKSIGEAINNTATLTITKVDAEDSTKKLTGAVFTLTKGATTLTSVDNKDGTYTISGINADGDWTLKETTAPAGYQLPSSKIWTIAVIKESSEDLTDGKFVTTNTYKISSVDGTALAAAVKTYDMSISNAINWDTDKVNPASLTITKVDGEDDTKLSGAEFTLTKQDDSTADAADTSLTETTGEDGTCTFTGLTEGVYTLEETTAPDGYKQTSKTWTIVVEKNAEPTEIVLTTDKTKFQKVYDCTVSELVENEDKGEDEYAPLTNGLTVTNDKAPDGYTVTLPIQKIVEKKAGSKNPGKTTFAFAATMYDGQTETTTKYGTAAIETNGVGTYDGTLKIEVPADLFPGGNGRILLQASEVKGTNSKWSYDDTVYIVLIVVEDYEVTRVDVIPEIALLATDDEEQEPTVATFTNTYSYKYTPTPKPTTVTSVQTGDMGVALYAVTSLLSLSGAAVIIKKRKDEE